MYQFDKEFMHHQSCSWLSDTGGQTMKDLKEVLPDTLFIRHDGIGDDEAGRDVTGSHTKPDVTSPEVTMYNMYYGNMYNQGDQLFDVNTQTGHQDISPT
jgi:hypothetical protein